MADVRPPPFSIRLSSLVSLPYRLCHPPHPTAAKVRSCSVVPSFQVALDDVLERRHLPPLGLKDFEEWLLFVEQKPQYLYFILWLKEYNRRYAQWAKTSLSEGKTRIGTRTASGPLAIFYTRAKQTFFAQLSPYQLSEISQPTLSQFIKPPMDSDTDSPHPHPSAFCRAESEARAILSQSLEAFVRASFANVSSYRAICGIIGGIVISLIFGILPLLLVLFLTSSRWLRWVGLPGLFVGFTIFTASCHGLCVGIYIFGDARQLRNFELVRPPIEKTTAMPITPITPTFTSTPTSPSPAALIRHQWMTQSSRAKKSSSNISMHSFSTAEPSAGEREGSMDIYVSPAMDPDTGECSPTASFHQAESQAESHGPEELLRTASFIPYNRYDSDQPREVQGSKLRASEEHFDFNGLPPPLSPYRPRDSNDTPISPEKSTPSQPRPISQRRSDVDLENGRISAGEGTLDQATRQPDTPEPHYDPVPPFGPLTPIMNPVVVRAHWEIMARSSVIGGVVSLAVVGALVGIPEIKFGTAMNMI